MIRVGHGYDIHKLVEGRPLIMGGVEIPYDKGLLGHSDSDVVLHAVSDALLGAMALGDIGEHFPDTDERYKNADSRTLLRFVVAMLEDGEAVINNIDVTIIAEAPKLSSYKATMRENIAADCGLALNQINIKATTHEKLDAVGQGEAIAVHCVSLIELKQP